MQVKHAFDILKGRLQILCNAHLRCSNKINEAWAYLFIQVSMILHNTCVQTWKDVVSEAEPQEVLGEEQMERKHWMRNRAVDTQYEARSERLIPACRPLFYSPLPFFRLCRTPPLQLSSLLACSWMDWAVWTAPWLLGFCLPLPHLFVPFHTPAHTLRRRDISEALRGLALLNLPAFGFLL